MRAYGKVTVGRTFFTLFCCFCPSAVALPPPAARAGQSEAWWGLCGGGEIATVLRKSARSGLSLFHIVVAPLSWLLLPPPLRRRGVAGRGGTKQKRRGGGIQRLVGMRVSALSVAIPSSYSFRFPNAPPPPAARVWAGRGLVGRGDNKQKRRGGTAVGCGVGQQDWG